MWNGPSAQSATILRGEGAPVAPLDDLVERLERDEFDLAAVSRALVADPHWVTMIGDGRFSELSPFDPHSLRTVF